jgi:hypothetical protein
MILISYHTDKQYEYVFLPYQNNDRIRIKIYSLKGLDEI